MTAEERRKASGPLIYWAAAAPAHRGAATVVRRSALRLPLWEAKTSPPVRSRQAFLKRERRPGCEPHRGNAVPRRHRRACCLTLWIGTLFPPPRSGGGGPLELAKRANRGGGGAGLGASLSVQRMTAMKLL